MPSGPARGSKGSCLPWEDPDHTRSKGQQVVKDNEKPGKNEIWEG